MTARALEGGAQPVDAVRFFEGITSQIVARHFFGEDVGEIPGLAENLLAALNVVLGNPFALPSTWRTPVRRRIHAQLALLERDVGERLRLRERHPGRFNDLAAHVVAARTESDGQTLDRIARLLVGALLAAHRVPAAAAGWVMMLVANRPELVTSLRSEAEAPFLPSARPRASPRRPSLAMAVVLEALRLYPPTWLLSRTTRHPVEVNGYRLRAGHTVLISPYVVHRDEAVYLDAGTFDPGRWLTDTQPAPFLSFGLGTRACPGSNLGLTSLTALLTALVTRFRIVQEQGEVRPNPRTSLTPDGLRLRFVPL